jgi:hypothetical protein
MIWEEAAISPRVIKLHFSMKTSYNKDKAELKYTYDLTSETGIPSTLLACKESYNVAIKKVNCGAMRRISYGLNGRGQMIRFNPKDDIISFDFQSFVHILNRCKHLPAGWGQYRLVCGFELIEKMEVPLATEMHNNRVFRTITRELFQRVKEFIPAAVTIPSENIWDMVADILEENRERVTDPNKRHLTSHQRACADRAFNELQVEISELLTQEQTGFF